MENGYVKRSLCYLFQAWEFKHTYFQIHRTDLLKNIKVPGSAR